MLCSLLKPPHRKNMVAPIFRDDFQWTAQGYIPEDRTSGPTKMCKYYMISFQHLCRHNRKSAAVFATSRSGSLERGSSGGAWGPAQPFVADPSMPPLPHPHTATQLEEARRRLLEEDGRPKTVRQRYSWLGR